MSNHKSSNNSLYHKLALESEACQIEDNDLDWIAIRISGLSIDHAKIIQGLILHHRHLEGGTEALPYNGSLLTKDRGAKYDLDQMPIKLRKILKVYLLKITSQE